MTKRIQRLVAAVAALSALALGGAVFAQAQTSHPAASERTSGPDRDNIQSGDQTIPDTTKGSAARPARHSRHHVVRVSRTTAAEPARGGNGQSGNQSTPDSGSANEAPGVENPESGPGSESAPGNDGPGGHADEPGSPNADHQFQGNE